MPPASAAVPAAGKPPRVLALGCAAVIVGVVAAIYARTWQGPFLYDDVDAIAGNASLRHLATAFSPPAGTTASGRPVFNASLALSFALGGGQVWAFHLGNLLIHAGAALLLFGVVRRTLVHLGRADALPVAFVSALVWAVHPLQTESVAYMVQRAEALMGLFLLLSLYGFVRWAQAGRRAPGWAILSVVAALGAMGSKEVGVVLPVVLFLYDWTFFGGGVREILRRGRAVYGGVVACWLPLAFWVAGTGGRGGTAGFGSTLRWWDYLLTQFTAVVHYARLAVWPYPLVGDYGWILARDPLQIAFCGALVAGAAAASVHLIRRRSPWGFLGAWYLVILAPSSSVVPVSTEVIAEHRVYLSLAALTVGLCAAASARWGRSVLLVAGMTVATLLAVVSFERTRVYDSPLDFWGDVVAKVPGNAGAWNNLGNVRLEAGDRRGAIEDYLRSLALVPTYAYAHYNLANALAADGHPAEAVEHYERALDFRPDDASIHFNLGNALARQQRWYPAAAQYREALRCDPSRTDARYNLGDAMVRVGNLPEAEAAFAQVVRERPASADARVNLGSVLAQEGRAADAETHFREALRIDPTAADVHNNLGGILAGEGHLAEARAEFEAALRLRPDFAEARQNLARVEALMKP